MNVGVVDVILRKNLQRLEREIFFEVGLELRSQKYNPITIVKQGFSIFRIRNHSYILYFFETSHISGEGFFFWGRGGGNGKFNITSNLLKKHIKIILGIHNSKMDPLWE